MYSTLPELALLAQNTLIFMCSYVCVSVCLCVCVVALVCLSLKNQLFTSACVSDRVVVKKICSSFTTLYIRFSGPLFPLTPF